jgi:Xaa-Pro aminopeptidase
MFDPELYVRRRAAFLDAMAARFPNSIAWIPSAPAVPQGNDVFRQDSDFFYLTGFDEPGSVLFFDSKEKKTTVFVRPKNVKKETWDGPRAGVDCAKELCGAQESFSITQLDAKLCDLVKNHKTLLVHLGFSRANDDRVIKTLHKLRAKKRKGIVAPSEVVDPAVLLHEMRLRKGPEDLTAMSKAIAITAEAHARAMASARPGTYEYEIEALMLDTFRRNGSERPAYGTIVASGPNACVLHYRSNRRQMLAGDLLLIDAGCEYDYFASDVTRTFPLGGVFSREQQILYELVLEAQIEAIAAVRVGTTLEKLQKGAARTMVSGLLRLGLMEGDLDEVVKKQKFKPFYPHRIGHWLGMDVHDVGEYFIDGKPRPLEAGMVITVEPGLYIPLSNETVAAQWRGLGVRIEDDVLVTETGRDVLTKSIPKTVDELRYACSGAS